MRYLLGMIAAAAIAASPAVAQDNMAGTDPGNEVNATAAEPVAADPTLNGVTAYPDPAATATPVETAPARPARKESFPWGILGLLGLVGLFGSIRR